MKKSLSYQKPLVIQAVVIQTETAFLKGSVVDTVVVTSVGQDVEVHDFSSEEFNHQWE